MRSLSTFLRMILKLKFTSEQTPRNASGKTLHLVRLFSLIWTVKWVSAVICCRYINFLILVSCAHTRCSAAGVHWRRPARSYRLYLLYLYRQCIPECDMWILRRSINSSYCEKKNPKALSCKVMRITWRVDAILKLQLWTNCVGKYAKNMKSKL